MRVSILVLLMAIPAQVFCGNALRSTDRKYAPEYSEIAHKITLIQNYSGYLFNVLIINRKPQLVISYETGEKLNGKMDVSSNVRYEIRPDISKEQKSEIFALVNELSNFRPDAIKLSSHGSRDRSTICFDYLDKKGNDRISKWYDLETGFCVKTAIYDKNGRLLSVTIYKKLLVNKKEKPFFIKREMVKLKYGSCFDEIRNIDFNSIDQIGWYCDCILEKYIHD